MYNEKHPQSEGTDFETHSKFFWTPFWSNSIPEWVDEIDKACQVHLDMAHERESSKVEKIMVMILEWYIILVLLKQTLN